MVPTERSSRDRILVVGAGLRGLTAAARLAGHFRVQVVERGTRAGGESSADDPAVGRMMMECDRAGVRFRLGETALRWHGGQLFISGTYGAGWVAADGLVLAGGTRPSSLAELGVHGCRPTGVVPAPAAIALLQEGARLGQRPLILGSGVWAQAASSALERSGAVVRQLTYDPSDRIVVRGRRRVEGVELERSARRVTFECDLLVLAARPVPMRCVQGAVFPPVASALFLDEPREPDARVRDVVSHVGSEVARFEEALKFRSAQTRPSA